MSEFSRRVDIHVFKDEPVTLEVFTDTRAIQRSSYVGAVQTDDHADDEHELAYRDYLDSFQPYRWHAVAMNNKIISDGESYYNLDDLIETLELFAGDYTTVYATHMFGQDRGLKLLRYGKTDRDHQAQQ